MHGAQERGQANLCRGCTVASLIGGLSVHPQGSGARYPEIHGAGGVGGTAEVGADQCRRRLAGSGGPAERELVDRQLGAALVELLVRGELVVRNPRVPFLERYDELMPGQVHAQAAVRAGAEREVMVDVLAVDVEGERIRELLRVVVGGGEAEPDDVALLGSRCPA
jgi:hypothetical protein